MKNSRVVVYAQVIRTLEQSDTDDLASLVGCSGSEQEIYIVGVVRDTELVDSVLVPGLTTVGSVEKKSGTDIVFSLDACGQYAMEDVELVEENPLQKHMKALHVSAQLPVSSNSSHNVDDFLNSLDSIVLSDTGMVLSHTKDSRHLAPSLSINVTQGQVNWTTFCMNVMCFIPSTGSDGKGSVASALRRQVASMRSMFESNIYGPSYHFEAFHFWPERLGFPVCMVYPVKEGTVDDDGEQSIAQRRAVQHALGLGDERPFLRIANSISSIQGESPLGQKVGRLRCVDRGLERKATGTLHQIQGAYEYYHYMQDNIDDSGWGCAYRSLQTICSWLKMQGYTARDPPSHQEIQKTLVALGDKQASFVGSKNWIGAIELGYVLDSLYQVECKIITVSDGAEMASVARQIGQHFDTQGTPIMIGGGVLAYTLLGIDYDEATGDCAFLILDPHYTGSDDLAKIHKGKWVAWKSVGDKAAAGGDLFVSGAFYNLLCPQRPHII